MNICIYIYEAWWEVNWVNWKASSVLRHLHMSVDRVWSHIIMSGRNKYGVEQKLRSQLSFPFIPALAPCPARNCLAWTRSIPPIRCQRPAARWQRLPASLPRLLGRGSMSKTLFLVSNGKIGRDHDCLDLKCSSRCWWTFVCLQPLCPL